MKGKEIITHAVRAEMPDMEQLRENSIRQATEKRTIKHGVWAKRLIPAAVCLAVVLAATIVFLHFDNNSITVPGTISNETSNNNNIAVPGTISNETSNDQSNSFIDSAMRGLPVDNFNLANVENGGAAMSRIGFLHFGSFFEYGVDCFAIVRITDTKILEAEYVIERVNKFGEEFDIDREITPKRQISDVEILESVYGEYGSDTIQITQSVIENHFCIGTTNLLRKGGVYLLPLKHSDGNWDIMGDMDVLFEIDDKGKVWSHSDFEDFKRHDGKGIEAFIEDMQNMFADNDFMLANSPFGGVLREWTLADIKITSSKKAGTDRYGQPCFSYEFAVNEILSDPNQENSAPLGKTGTITVHTDETDPIEFIDGNRYLICLDRYESEIYVNTSMIAEVENDDTITAIPAPNNQSYLKESIFTSYDGYKTSDIREMVLRIEAWREAQK